MECGGLWLSWIAKWEEFEHNLTKAVKAMKGPPMEVSGRESVIIDVHCKESKVLKTSSAEQTLTEVSSWWGLLKGEEKETSFSMRIMKVFVTAVQHSVKNHECLWRQD